MIFSSKAAECKPLGKQLGTQRTVSGLVSALGSALALVALAGLASCGGGTTQYEPFVPQRVFAFGDDSSALTASGRRYGVNGLDANGNFDCNLQPLWVQSVAGFYGFSFAECNPTGVDPKAKMFAAVGTRAGELTAQVEAQVASGGFRSTDLALVLVGANDVIELYRQYPGRAEASLLAEAGARGHQLARVVNRLVDLGAKVIVSTVPDMGVSPFARTETAANFDTDRGAMLSRISAAFNEQLGVNIILDGRYVGLMQTDLRIQGAGRSPGSFGLVNSSSGVCTVTLPECTTATLVDGAVATQYLWADETRLAPGGQSQLAALALDRARRNPF